MARNNNREKVEKPILFVVHEVSEIAISINLLLYVLIQEDCMFHFSKFLGGLYQQRVE